MLRLTWRNVLARKVRLALSGFAIILGVAFVAGSFIFTDAMGSTFDGIIEGSTSDVEVTAKGANTFQSQEDSRVISRSVVDRLGRLPGASASHATVALQTVYVIGKNGKVVGGNGPPGLAGNDTGARSVNGKRILTLSQGRLPDRDGEVALDVDTARRAGYSLGDRVTLATTGKPATLKERLVGEVQFGSGGLNGATLTVLDLRSLQRHFYAGRDVFTKVSLDTAPGVSQQQLRTEAAKVLPRGLEARTGDSLVKANKAQLDKFLGFLNKFLLVFAGVSLVVGIYLIVNTFSILVAQRSRELALLRALGASRQQVNRAVLLEALVVGLVGSTIGLGVGYLLALGLQQLFGAIGFDLSSASFVIGPRTVLASYAVGVFVTMVAAYLPARRAAQLPPVAALRDDVALPESSLRRRVLGGAVLVVGGAVAMALGLDRSGNTALILIGAGMLAVLVGVSLLSPWLGRPLTRLFEIAYRRLFGTVGVLASQNSLRNPRRTAATASALMIGLTLVALMSVLGQSATASVDSAVKKTLTSQFVVSNVVGTPFTPSVASRIRALDGVEQVSELRSAAGTIRSKQVFVGAVDPRTFGLALAVPAVRGSMAALRSGTIAMAQTSATRRGLSIGDTVPLKLQGGTVKLRLVATFGSANALPANYLVTLDTLAKGGLKPLDSLVYVTKSPSGDTAAVRAGIKRIIKGLPTVTVKDPQQFAEQQRGQIDIFLSFIYALLGLAVVIAILGIVNTLALSVIERTREIGLLRAVGVARRQLRRIVRLEAVIVAVLGAVLGVGMGLVFGVALQRSIADQGVDVLSVPWVQLLVFVLLAAVAGVLAAVLPARRAARLDVLGAIGTE